MYKSWQSSWSTRKTGPSCWTHGPVDLFWWNGREKGRVVVGEDMFPPKPVSVLLPHDQTAELEDSRMVMISYSRWWPLWVVSESKEKFRSTEHGCDRGAPFRFFFLSVERKHWDEILLGEDLYLSSSRATPLQQVSRQGHTWDSTWEGPFHWMRRRGGRERREE